MIASVLIYVGALLAILGLAALVVPRRPRARRGRTIGLFAALAGIGLGLLGVGMPARDSVVGQPRERLDTVMPRYQFRERHALRVAATPLEVDRAIRAVTADEIRFYRVLTWVRRLGRRGPESLIDAPHGVPILALATRSGFRLLADDPGRELVLGVAGPASPAARAAARTSGPHPFTPSAGGYASIALAFRVEPDGRGGAILSTETRVFAPDAATRRRLTTYWRLIYPGSALIRRGWLVAIRRRAEAATR
jgi:hypothetical protein